MKRRDMMKGLTIAAGGAFLPAPLFAKPNMGDNWGNSADVYLQGNFGPVPVESTLTDLEVTGELPVDLVGRYLRNGPNPSGEVGAGHHWFVGDGMVHGIHIREGKAVWYRNRYVKGGPNTHVHRPQRENPRDCRGRHQTHGNDV